jgi:hypothetical protein
LGARVLQLRRARAGIVNSGVKGEILATAKRPLPAAVVRGSRAKFSSPSDATSKLNAELIYSPPVWKPKVYLTGTKRGGLRDWHKIVPSESGVNSSKRGSRSYETAKSSTARCESSPYLRLGLEMDQALANPE